MAKKTLMTVEEAAGKLVSAGLSILKHANNSDSCTGVNHITIYGSARVVEFWPGTGTVYANGVKGKFKAARGKGIDDAIRIAKDGK